MTRNKITRGADSMKKTVDLKKLAKVLKIEVCDLKNVISQINLSFEVDEHTQ
jgi:hypothetical protein